MEASSTFKHFKIAHQLQRRIRVIAPALRKDLERAYILQMLLLKRKAIENVRIAPAIASVTIEFDPEQLPKENLLQLLEAVLANIGLKPESALKDMAQNKNKSSQPQRQYTFAIEGMSCSSCALYLEMMLKRDPGIGKANVNFLTETAVVSGSLNKKDLFERVAKHGFKAVSIDTLTERKRLFEHERQHRIKAKKQLLLAGFLSLPVPLVNLLPFSFKTKVVLQALLAAPVVLCIGADFFDKARLLAKDRSADMDTLIALGAGTAYGYSFSSLFTGNRHVYFEAATGIVFFVLLGRYLEEIAKKAVLKDIRNLVNRQPERATLLRGEEEIVVAAEAVNVGDILLIRPGEKIPADGVVIKGLSMVDESMVTGAAMHCIKEAGHQVYDGCINGTGVLHVQATAVGVHTVLSGLINRVDQAQVDKLPIQQTADTIASIFVPTVLGLSGLTFAGWNLAGAGVAHALANAVAVLLIACPCALGLATPGATLVGTGRAAGRGIYIKNGTAFETAAAIDTVIFDKTGTITEGNSKVTDLFNVSGIDDADIVRLAASAEFNSEHSLARAIVELARLRGLPLRESSHFLSLPDQGIRATVDEHELLLGSEAWLTEQDIDLSMLASTAKKLSAEGKTLVFMVVDGKASALFAVADRVRAAAPDVVRLLNLRGIKTVMLTGDTEPAARYVAAQVAVDELIAGAGPAKKLKVIRKYQQQGHKVAMVGDGINDAPALAAADLGLAVDNAAAITKETADVILVGNDIGKVVETLELSEKTVGIIRQNLIWAFGYNALAVPVAMSGKLNPFIAAAAMALSSVSVVANSLRLKKK
ncbi:MAG: heavy metal translocating P-type ATPase [Gammaproteobacteria bacterium]